MIELVVLNYLTEQMDVPVYAEEPEEKPERYVLIEKTGSSINNHIRRATFAIQSYAPSMIDAMALNEEVKMVMDDAAILPEIARSHLNSDYNYTDTETKRYRYQAVYELVHY